MATLTSTGITFSDGSTQASGSAFGAIGTYAYLYKTANTKNFPPNTISGVYLFYVSSVGSSGFVPNIDKGQPTGNRVNATTAFTSYSGVNAVNYTPVTGTWRLLNANGAAVYDGCLTTTTIYGGLYVRVS